MTVSGEILNSDNGIQTLRCSSCNEIWTRPAIVGRVPKYCDACRKQAPALKAPKAEPRNNVTPIKGGHHKAFKTLLQVCEARIPAMLVGPAGSGKSTAGRQVANALNLSFSTESCNPQMSKWDIMGFMNAQGGYTPGVIREAFENGGVVLLDEIDASNPAVLVSINLVASVRIGETVTFPDGADVARHENFILITGGNTYGDGASDEYVGREQLDAATLDRFAMIEWGYDETLEFVAAGPDAGEWVEYVQRVRKAAAKAQVDLLITPRASINGAQLLRNGMARTVVENLTIWKGISADAKRTIKAELAKTEPVAPATTEGELADWEKELLNASSNSGF